MDIETRVAICKEVMGLFAAKYKNNYTVTRLGFNQFLSLPNTPAPKAGLIGQPNLRLANQIRGKKSPEAKRKVETNLETIWLYMRIGGEVKYLAKLEEDEAG